MPATHALAGLKAARIAAGVDPQILADRIGVHLHSYYRFEAGTRQLFFGKVCALADAIGCSVDTLRRDPDENAALGGIVVSLDGSIELEADATAELKDWTI